MPDQKQGYVYILTNPSFKDDWVKIGKSSRPVDVRSKELDNTAVPLPFEIYATMQTEKFAEVEKLVHKMIDRLTDLRIRQNREFFNIAPSDALDILKDIAPTIPDAVVYEYIAGKPVQCYPKQEVVNVKVERKTQKAPFKFSMIGLKVGDVVTFIPTKLQVKVATDNKIEHEGRLWSLSAFTGTFLPADQQNNSGAYQGPKYFSYEGKSLAELRNENGK